MLLDVHRKTVVNDWGNDGECELHGNSLGMLNGEPRNISSGIHAKIPEIPSQILRPDNPQGISGKRSGTGTTGALLHV